MERINQRNQWALLPIWIVLILPFLSVYALRNFIDPKAYQAWQIFAMLLSGTLVVYSAREILVDLYSGLFVAFQLELLLATTLRWGLSFGIVTMVLSMTFLFLLLQTSFYEQMLRALAVLIVVLVLLNLPGLLLRPDSGDELYFIGGKNSFGIVLIPGAFLILLHALERSGKPRRSTYVWLALCLLTVLLGASGTGMVVTVVATVATALAAKFKPPKWVCLTVIVIFYIVFIFFAEDFIQTRFWEWLTDLLGKDSTLTSRTAIWKTVKLYVGKYWLFGVGRGVRIPYINVDGLYRVNYESHNFVLEILLEGGFLALLLYGTLLFYTVKHLNMNDLKQRMVFVALCVLLVNGLTESTLNSCFVTLMLGIACRYAAENRRNLKPNEHKV